MTSERDHKPRAGLFSGLNALETVVLAAIVLVALAGMMLVGKGLFLQSRLVAGPGYVAVAAL
jgi:hypothetical protein